VAKRKAGDPLARPVRKHPKAGERGEGGSDDEVVITGHATAAAAAAHTTSGDEEATSMPATPTIGQRNQATPRDRSANSQDARMAAARLAGQQRQKKHAPRMLPVGEEGVDGAAPAPAEAEDHEEDEQDDEEEQGDEDEEGLGADTDWNDPGTGRPARPESARRSVSWLKSGARC
jgi:hypothetical protein